MEFRIGERVMTRHGEGYVCEISGVRNKWIGVSHDNEKSYFHDCGTFGNAKCPDNTRYYFAENGVTSIEKKSIALSFFAEE